MTLQAIIFDFNGVIVDDEPIHQQMFQRVMAEEGLSFSPQQYFEKYLIYDDRNCFLAALSDAGREVDEAYLSDLIQRKSRYYAEQIRDHLILFPGVVECVEKMARRWPLAIASGAQRHEIEVILQRTGLERHFAVVISSDEVAEGKPSPQIYLRALARLNARQHSLGQGPILAQHCLVIEDSPGGIVGAHAAGMRCLAVTNSYPPQKLAAADLVTSTLQGFDPSSLESLFR